MRYQLSPREHCEYTVCVLLLTLLVGCFIFSPSSQAARLAQDLDSHFLQHQIVELGAPTVAAQVQQTASAARAICEIPQYLVGSLIISPSPRLNKNLKRLYT